MPTSQKKIASNRCNAKRSTGPKTYDGKNITKYNGMVHGLTARTAVIPSEDPAEYDRLMADVAGTLRPRNAVEVMLISQACQANWAHTRSVKAETARLAARIEAAPDEELDQIDDLFARLFHDTRVPNVISGAIPYNHIGTRTSHCGQAINPDEPAKLLRKICSSVIGCERLLACWQELRELLEPGRAWQGNHKFKAVRMLGKQPTDVLNSREIADLYVACWSIHSPRSHAYAEIRSDLGRFEFKHFRRRVRATWTDMMNALDEDNSRRVLVAIVERAMAQVKEKAAVAQERAERDAARRADCLSFDGSHEAELLRRYTTSSHRQFVRSLNEFFKVRKETEESGGELELAADERAERSSDSWPPKGPESQAEDQTREEWIEAPAIDPFDPTDPTDLAPTTDSPHPTDRTDPDGPELLMSIAPTNLRTEPKLGCAAAPNNPGMASSETESDGCDVTEPQYEQNDAVAIPAETEPNNVDVPHADLERQSAAAAGCEAEPNRRLESNAVLLWTTILVLFCSSLLADAARRTSRADGEESRRAAAFSATPTRRAGAGIAGLGSASARPILTRRASEGISSSHSARAGSISTRRASFDAAPSVGRPEGAVTNQPQGNALGTRPPPTSLP